MVTTNTLLHIVQEQLVFEYFNWLKTHALTVCMKIEDCLVIFKTFSWVFVEIMKFQLSRNNYLPFVFESRVLFPLC